MAFKVNIRPQVEEKPDPFAKFMGGLGSFAEKLPLLATGFAKDPNTFRTVNSIYQQDAKMDAEREKQAQQQSKRQKFAQFMDVLREYSRVIPGEMPTPQAIMDAASYVGLPMNEAFEELKGFMDYAKQAKGEQPKPQLIDTVDEQGNPVQKYVTPKAGESYPVYKEPEKPNLQLKQVKGPTFHGLG